MEEIIMSRHDDAFEIRKKAAKLAHDRDFAKNHPDNGEEDKYKDLDGNRNFIANYTKGLKHHELTNRDAGEVINPDYRKLVDAIKSEKPQDFENLPLGLGRKFTNPQAGYGFDLEGPDSHDLAIRPAPKIDSAEAAGEMAELYWMALCRDIPFSKFDTDGTVAEAVADLSSNYNDFPHSPFPGPALQITPNTIFRGIGNGVLTGQYISQFLYKDIKWGAQVLQQKQRIVTSQDYLTDYQSWLDAQDGKNIPPDDQFDGTEADTRYIITPRDLAYWVHVDALYQGYLGACLILLGDGNKFDPLLPYQNSNTQIGFGTFGGPHTLSLVTEVATRALKAVWYQKWVVHRRLRPEAFGGLIHRQLNATSSSPTAGLLPPDPPYPINSDILGKTGPNQILEKIRTKYGSYLLPQAFPEGSPTHPAYGAGHATVAGACVTILKAWFDEDDLIKNPKKPTDDGTMLVDAGAPQLTVGGELNKVAANVAIGRNMGGVHYRSDYTESILLGEKIAIGILQEQALCYNEKFACTLTKFDGKKIKLDGTKIMEV
jgi:hypothetical protein